MNPWIADRRNEGRAARASLVRLRAWRASGRVFPAPDGRGYAWRVDIDEDGGHSYAVDGAAPTFLAATDAAEAAAVNLARARVV